LFHKVNTKLVDVDVMSAENNNEKQSKGTVAVPREEGDIL
jgi:hypothetical protein